MRTLIEDGVFRDHYVTCKQCKTSQHVYFFPLNYKTKIRTLETCLACLQAPKASH